MMVTGCDATYNIEIKNEKFYETLEIHNYNKSSWENGNPTYVELINP